MTLEQISAALAACLVSVTALAQTPAPATRPVTVELEQALFVQRLLVPGAETRMTVAWIPQPVQKYCLDKTLEECSKIDFCIRTTTKNVPICRNLSVDAIHLPPYPPDTRPRRVLSVTYFRMAPTPRFDPLFKFFAGAPPETFDRLSAGAQFKARVKLIRTAQDDQFELLEVLEVPPF